MVETWVGTSTLSRTAHRCSQVRLQYIGRRSVSKNWSENCENVSIVSGYFLAVCNSTFFAGFSLSDSKCVSDGITSTKLEQTGKYFGTAEAV